MPSEIRTLFTSAAGAQLSLKICFKWNGRCGLRHDKLLIVIKRRHLRVDLLYMVK
jgi:hypothetical protein